MMTLEDAWDWYETTRSQLHRFARLGRKLWDRLPEDNPLWKDDDFKSLEPDTIRSDSESSREHLDDFAVTILFSVFEATVRDRVLKQIADERASIGPKLLAGVIDASLRDLRKRGFYRILDVFKGIDAGLVEEVNQVRRYRNWVAHGRRAAPSPSIRRSPTIA